MELLSHPDMDAATTEAVLQATGLLVCMGVPPGTRFGLDYAEWTVGDKFKGVKLVPPGGHYVWVSAAGVGGDLAPRTGFFFTAAAREAVVCVWDAAAETLMGPREVDVATAAAYATGARRGDFDTGMGPYPLKTASIWASLASHMTPAVLERLTPATGALDSTPALLGPAATLTTGPAPPAPAYVPLSPNPASAAAPTAASLSATAPAPPETAPPPPPDVDAERRRAAAHAAKLDAYRSTMYFSSIPGVGPGSTPADITQHAMDTSSALATVLGAVPPGEDLIGELQVAFAGFLLGQDLGAFMQWKHLVDLLCRCEGVLQQPEDWPAVTTPWLQAALQAVTAQINVLPQDLFADELSRDNFLRRSLLRLFKISSKAPARGLSGVLTTLQRACQSRFGWEPALAPAPGRGSVAVSSVGHPVFLPGDSDEDDDDDPPVVVDLGAPTL